MANPRILWADDEIELLKPHILFLNNKGYDVTTALSGNDALELVRANAFDLIILDENMPGLTGLETLQRIKLAAPHVPVIMITKSEEEDIMNQAVGNNIADYLIKPVKPNQILIALKKHIHSTELVTRQTQALYRRDFNTLGQAIDAAASLDDYKDLYQQLVHREMQLSQTPAAGDVAMLEMLEMQKAQANRAFTRHVTRHYLDWLDDESDSRPLMSPRVIPATVFPLLRPGSPVWLILIDNFRLDQWLTIQPLLAEHFNIDQQLYTSILPTATQYARNAVFSGLMPLQIQQMFPDLWVDEDSPEGKNLNESPLVETLFRRYRRQCRFSYTKINDSAGAERLLRNMANMQGNDLNVVVINFIDMLSHARTESRMIRELAQTDAAYRSLTLSWFRHSPTLEIFRRIASQGHSAVLTTDHGTIRVDTPVKVAGERNTNTNLRYKLGRNLGYNPRQVYEVKDPRRYGLPAPNVSTAYIFARDHDFFAYPNNYNHYVQYYTGTFQHGGISMEEMLIPLVKLMPK